MSWRDGLRPVRMQRVALVAPADSVHAMLERVGDAGLVELEPPPAEPTQGAEPAHGVESSRDAELARRAVQVVTSGPIAAIAGWLPAPALPRLAGDLEPVGAAAVPLTPPRGKQPPTLLQGRSRARAFDPLVQGYGTVPYADVDLTLVAGLAYVAMFGMMFGDLGHGLLLVVAAVLVRRSRRLSKVRRAFPFVLGAGLAAALFGVLFGEFFGPTGVLPVLWLSPLDEPVSLLLAAVGVGTLLLAGAYAVGTVNRVNEGGWLFALYARTGLAGGLLFLAFGLTATGVYFGAGALIGLGIGVGALALILAFVGLLATAGGGPAGVAQATVELFDLVIRLGSSLISFGRLAAFGLAHTVLSTVIWNGTTALWGGGLSAVAAIALFVAGNAVALSLAALVAGIQALRLEYYELFSRVFTAEGRPFRPWRLPQPESREVTT